MRGKDFTFLASLSNFLSSVAWLFSLGQPKDKACIFEPAMFLVFSFSPFLPGKQFRAFFSCFMTIVTEKKNKTLLWKIQGESKFPREAGLAGGVQAFSLSLVQTWLASPRRSASNTQPFVGLMPTAVFNVVMFQS